MRASAAASRQSLNQRRPEIRAAPEQEGREGLFGFIWSFVGNILPLLGALPSKTLWERAFEAEVPSSNLTQSQPVIHLTPRDVGFASFQRFMESQLAALSD